tara:strand:- start:264 stop:539 length:276 start_codon:yes stop_codon:yes gene_type:complete
MRNNRYANSKYKNKDGKLGLQTTYYHKIVESSEDIVVRTVFGDRFDKLAHQYYGDPSLWWYIAKANDMKFNALESGIEIIIPAKVDNVEGY